MLDVRRADIGVWIGSADFNILLTPVLAYPNATGRPVRARLCAAGTGRGVSRAKPPRRKEVGIPIRGHNGQRDSPGMLAAS